MFDISDIAGIGPKISQKLKSTGVDTVEKYLEQGSEWEGLQKLAATSNVSEEKAADWLRMADFFRLGDDMTEGWSLLLNKIGVGGARDLSNYKAGNVLSMMGNVVNNLDHGIKTDIPSLGTVKNWIGIAGGLPAIPALAKAASTFGWEGWGNDGSDVAAEPVSASSLSGSGSVDSKTTIDTSSYDASLDADMPSADLDVDTKAGSSNFSMNGPEINGPEMNGNGGGMGFLKWLLPLLILLGLLWLLTSNWSSWFGDAKDAVSDATDSVTETVQDAADTVTDTAKDAVDTASDTINDVAGDSSNAISLAGALGDLPYTTLTQSLKNVDLVDALDNGSDEFTLFAPTNAAFSNAKSSLDGAPNNVVGGILSNHVVEGKYELTDLTDGLELKSLGGAPINVTVEADQVLINGVNVAEADLSDVDNADSFKGSIFEIPEVMFLDLVAASALDVPEGELDQEIPDAPAIGGDTIFDRLMYKAGEDFANKYAEGNTVFAPNDAAFTAAGVDEDALEGETLEAVLKNHIIEGQVSQAALLEAGSATTLGGYDFTVKEDLEDGEEWIHFNGTFTQHILKTTDLGFATQHDIDVVFAD